MAIQVVTNDNVMDLIQGKDIPAFKAPEAEKPAEVKPGVKEVPRAEDGTFKAADKVEEKQEEKPADKEAGKTADDDDLSEASEAIRKKIDRLISKKHRAMKEAEEFGRDEARRAMAAEARAEELQKQIDALKAPAKSEGPDAKDGDEPDQADFKTVGEYHQAWLRWDAAKRDKAGKAESVKQTQKQAQEAAEKRLIAQVGEARKEYPDYAEVMKSVTWEAPQHVAGFIIDSDNGARMAYHLAKNPDAYDRIAALSPIKAIAELGAMEKELFGKKPVEKQEDKPAAQVSKAPPPITPLEAKTVPVETDPAKMGFKQLRELREQQRRKGEWRV